MATPEPTVTPTNVPQVESDDSFSILPYLLLLLPIVIWFLCCRSSKNTKQKKRSGSSLFIIGENGSGKTTLLYYLNNKTQIQTVSSIAPNEGKLKLTDEEKEKLVDVLEIPGHHHMRSILHDRVAEAKAIVLVVDSNNRTTIPGTASLLYETIIDPKKEANILIALNKQDLPGAKKAADFEDELTAEIERIKISRRAIRDDSEASSEDFLKEESKRFNAGDYGISFCEVSVNRGEIESVQKFINDQFFQGQMTSFFVIYMFTIKF
eukprot:TRINITY_DN9453_c0_g1_i1.p1 TRINITY_DN9453_c0_g1~~TRINITY_DN9453_c0_g1_i1.p1  ORF type:complete len:265 (+),score=39.35 TRINITY_DN9453_c0_g1_i1:165-959(+)